MEMEMERTNKQHMQTKINMKMKFKTKRDACMYYDECNPYMRKMNALGTYMSDWDPKTKLLYIVRDDYNINETVSPFSKI